MGNLIEEAKAGNVEGVRRELDNGADVNQLDNGHDTALTWSSYNGHTEVVRLLLDRGADITITNGGGSTPLKLAQSYNRPEAAKLLEAAASRPREPWNRLGTDSLAHVAVYLEIDKKLTTIFNFSSRERVIIAETINKPAISIGPATSFDDLPQQVVEQALDEFTRKGGKADRDYVLSGASSLNKSKLGLSQKP